MHRHTQSDSLLRLARGADRRATEQMGVPPFITEEGLVLVDRRSYQERRQERCVESEATMRYAPVAA